MNRGDHARLDSWHLRLARALAIVAALVLAVPTSGLVARGVAGAIQAGSASEGIRAADIVGGLDPQSALARVEELGRDADVELPDYFEDEIGLPDGAHGVRVSESGEVVGYVMEGQSDEVMQVVREHMSSGGWNEVELGEVEGATFVKDTGNCVWTLVTCTQVESSTGVVFRSVVR